jgi:hypothetical protein
MHRSPNHSWLIWKYRRILTRARRRAGGSDTLAKVVNGWLMTLVTGCVATLLILAQGCATTPMPPAPPSAEVRAALGTVGMVSVGPPLGANVQGPIGVGKEIGRGAAKGGAIGGLSGAGAGALLGLATGPCAPIAVPLFAGIGAVGGVVVGGSTGAIINGVNAIPTEAATDIETALFKAIADVDVQAELRQRVLTHATVGGVGNRLDLGMGSAGDPVPVPDYASVTSSGVNTVLEIGIAQIALVGSGGRDPTLVLSLNARARLIRVPDNIVLWSDDQLNSASREADFSEWSANDSELLKSEIENGLQALALQISNKIFLQTTAAIH